MDKPNTIESLLPTSGQYSVRQDLRLNGWLLVATAAYVVELQLERANPGWSSLTRGLAALIPVIPGLFYVRSWMRFIRGMDELQRRIQVEAFLFAALVTVFLGAILNTLAARDVPLGPFEHGLTLGSLYMVLLVLWTVRTVMIRARYK